MGDKSYKAMKLWFKVQKARLRLFSQKLHKEAQKLALAVVIIEFIIAGSYAIAENKGYLEFLQPKTIYIEAVHAQETPRIEPQEPKTDRIDELADLIWLRESTRGQHNYSKCEQQGKINGIGYAISGNGKYICFDSHAEEMQVLRKWIADKQAKGMSETELLCLYSGSHYRECNN